MKKNLRHVVLLNIYLGIAILSCMSNFTLSAQENPPKQELEHVKERVSEQVREPATPDQTVEISSTKDPDWKSYRVMLKGLDAFEKYHAHAPQASPQFILKPRRLDVSLSGVNLRLASDESSRTIPLASDGSFVLPRDEQAASQRAELMINRKKEMFRWWPLVKSPGVATQHRRLGDLRLECEMFWAIHYDDLPFVARNLMRTVGGPCQTKKVILSFPAEWMGLQAATLVQGERRMNLAVDKDRSTYSITLYNPDFSDDALIELQFDADVVTQPDKKIRNVNGLNVVVKL
ncbi:hypothetical protein [Undibacterium flavidum]|uniref:Uncharacterized protein n=1 Tax=Undibacterium flavidum TaxID=2762297 RepID=A0ABR6YAR6_9BURK|nr:hypothetical protein [Undibacterium flavidum]MBC3873724.1 hypothetical protein [Undibacterium flavidum]